MYDKSRKDTTAAITLVLADSGRFWVIIIWIFAIMCYCAVYF